MYVFIFLVKITVWPPIGKIAAHSAYEMFSWYKCLIVSLVFSHLGFWSGNLSLIAPIPDLCLLVPFCLCLYSPVCVGLGRKPHCWFSYEAAHLFRALKSKERHYKKKGKLL